MNELQHEKSPYLLQHGGNPVSWRTWGQPAFDAAVREDKPIFLSVGCSTCHPIPKTGAHFYLCRGGACQSPVDSVAVLEADRIASGQTRNTTAKV